MSTLRLVMGDQLTHHLASLREADKMSDVIVMGELSAEATSVRHHKKKIALIFAAMRHFAKELTEAGFQVIYQHYDHDNGANDFSELLQDAAEQTGLQNIVMTRASEYRVYEWQRQFQASWPGQVQLYEDDRFLASHEDFSIWAKGKKQLRMEFFYREMRRKYNILIDDDKPVGGQWNYDSEKSKAAKIRARCPQ